MPAPTVASAANAAYNPVMNNASDSLHVCMEGIHLAQNVIKRMQAVQDTVMKVSSVRLYELDEAYSRMLLKHAIGTILFLAVIIGSAIFLWKFGKKFKAHYNNLIKQRNDSLLIIKQMNSKLIELNEKDFIIDEELLDLTPVKSMIHPKTKKILITLGVVVTVLYILLAV